ncbi:MAG TPA: prepilin-type N-terminal cleavage/methylation domain-containing protein [Planctomycetota bacterium]|nr:prepilin-type N-terminal cleavage/methylation domain-containing protein [Planctomycetota bacterium]
MKLSHRSPTGARSRGGFTLIEVIIAAVIMSLIGIGLTQGLHLANQTHESVTQHSHLNRDVRKAVSKLRNEFQSTSESRLTLALDGEGNQVLTLQVPVDSGFGVYDRALGSTPAEWNRDGWSLRYLVQMNAVGERELVRQILDAGGTVQRQSALASRLLTNDDLEGPGFSVAQTGDVWEIRLATRMEESNGVYTETFHVRLRN